MHRLWTVIAVIGLLAACTTHKIDVQQGNIITQEAVEKLKPGMDKRQVAVTIGSPLVTDPFSRDRWDYVYSLRQRGEETHYSHLVLRFEDEALTDIRVVDALLTEEEIRTLTRPTFRDDR